MRSKLSSKSASTSFAPSMLYYAGQHELDLSYSGTRPVPWLSGILLTISDLVSLFAAALLANALWFAFQLPDVSDRFFPLWPLLVIFLAGYMLLGLYASPGLGPIEELKRLTSLTTAICCVVVISNFAIYREYLLGSCYLVFWVVSLVLLPTGRTFTRHLFSAKPWWGVPVIVLGAGKTAKRVIDRVRSNPALGLKIFACLDDNPAEAQTPSSVPVIGSLRAASKISQRYRINHAIVAIPGLKPSQLDTLVNRYATSFRHITIIPDLLGLPNLNMAVRDLDGILGLHARQNLLVPVNRWIKRGIDLVLSLPLMFVSLPIIILAAIWIFVINRGSPFYIQEREGLFGKPIYVWKLRTMYKNADALLKEHLEQDPVARAEWTRYYKLKHDPRILPKIGTILRRTSLDELPQLWNVIKGDMTFVGPRPFPEYHLKQFDAEFRDLRRQVVPGITGMWQVVARSDGNLEVQKELDRYYIRNWSLWLDLYLLARTPWAVLHGKGAY